MNTPSILRKTLLAFGFAAAVTLPAQSQAAPGPLPKTPLYLTNSVEPNVFFLLDDSGSMDWEILYPDGVAGFDSWGGTPVVRFVDNTGDVQTRRVGYWHPGWRGSYMYNWIDVVPPANWSDPNPTATWDDNLWVFRNHQANKLYYNPMATYLPWKGADSSGNPLYTDANPTAVLRDPTDPGGDTVDLTQDHDWWDFVNGVTRTGVTFLPSYYTWDADTDGDGEVDPDEPHTLYQIRPGTPSYPSGRSYAEELQNFANWFQYYRKREFAAKAAVGGVINNTDATRMGLRVINGGQIQDVITMTDPVNKRVFLQTFYDTPSRRAGTPLRRGLDATGDYFMEDDADAPILPADQGGECQQNFALVMSDGFWNGGAPGGIGNADGDNSSSFDGDQTQSIDGGNYADGNAVTLADVAMHYYETDLRTLDNRVPTEAGVDMNDQQHLVTYTIGFGLTGSLDPDTFDPLATGFTWPNPMDTADEDRVDDMLHAAYNGRGLFLSAQDPIELENALNTALEDIAERTANAAAVAINSAQLTSESVVYVTQFNSNRWQGDLLAYSIDQTSGTLAANPSWKANELLTTRDLTSNPRQIITWNGSQGTAFQWNATNLSANMMNDLRTNPDGSVANDATAQARLEYLRGDRSNENSGYGFRPRPSLLGDLVNSGPIYVGKPGLRWPDIDPFPDTSGSRYSDYKNAMENREGIIYVGSNDGMLHAFSATDGKEIFAYVPNLIASTDNNEGYHYLTDPNYVHNWYVDLTPTLSDVFMTTSAGSGWRTILIGGLRGGGRGLFALDVTNPSNLDESHAAEIVMWEFSSSDDADLGYTYSRPTIALANNGRWVAIFGNGYNDSGDGEAKLFILDIEAGLDGWSSGDYIEISTEVGNSGNRNGLATPLLVDVDQNGTVDRVYAGDLEGNLWVFDLSSNNKDDWDSAYSTSGGSPAPLFTTDSGQAITAMPVASKHPTIPDSSSPSNAPNLMIMFGTGRYLVESDKTNTEEQAFYGVWDRGDKQLGTSDLVQQTVSSSFTGNSVITDNSVDYSLKHGWYLTLADSGERSMSEGLVRGDNVFFNSFVPENDPCSSGGHGYRYALDIETGGMPKESIYDINNDGKFDNQDNLDNGSDEGVISRLEQEGFLSKPVSIEGEEHSLVFTNEVPLKVRPLKYLPTGRFAWQELIK